MNIESINNTVNEIIKNLSLIGFKPCEYKIICDLYKKGERFSADITYRIFKSELSEDIINIHIFSNGDVVILSSHDGESFYGSGEEWIKNNGFEKLEVSNIKSIIRYFSFIYFNDTEKPMAEKHEDFNSETFDEEAKTWANSKFFEWDDKR